MNARETIEIYKKRDYLVVKGNDLIQKSRFSLSLPEQKAIAYICSMIKPISASDSVSAPPLQLEYEFNIRDFCKVCGIDYAGGKNYKSVKETLKKLADRSMWLDDGESEILMRWLAYVKINKKSERVWIEIDRMIAPFLFDLKEKFTQYQLYNILAMKSAFSVRIYELLKSYEFRKTMEIELDELKRLLMVDDVKSYDRFPDFRRRVLEPAVEEINALTDINIDYETILKGRKVQGLIFNISCKNVVDQTVTAARVHNQLDNN